jgi:hypothetical protein
MASQGKVLALIGIVVLVTVVVCSGLAWLRLCAEVNAKH